MVKKILIIFAALSVAIGICFLNALVFNTKQIQVRQVILKSDKIDKNCAGLLIAYFSDLHYGTYIDDAFLSQTVNKINEYDPDIVIFGGDLIDHYSLNGISEENRTYLIAELKSLKTKYGKYAILGNHDLTSQAGKNDIGEILKEADFRIIDNIGAVINVDRKSTLNIVGLDSVGEGSDDIGKAFYGINTDHYTLVVSHFPDVFDSIINYDFDYMLAGHSHGGQVYIPLISLFTRVYGCEKYFRGKYNRDNKILDITTGVGRTRYDARFLADAEIVMYRLESTKTNTAE